MKIIPSALLIGLVTFNCSLLIPSDTIPTAPDTNTSDTTKVENLLSAISARINQPSSVFDADSFIRADQLLQKLNHSTWKYSRNSHSIGSHGRGITISTVLTIDVVSRLTTSPVMSCALAITDSGSIYGHNPMGYPTTDDTTSVYQTAVCTLTVINGVAQISGGGSTITESSRALDETSRKISRSALYGLLNLPVDDTLRIRSPAYRVDSISLNASPALRASCQYITYLQGVGVTHLSDWYLYDNYNLVSVDGQPYDSIVVRVLGSVYTGKTSIPVPPHFTDISPVNGAIFAMCDGGILRSTDGTVWDALKIPGGSVPTTLCFVDKNTGWYSDSTSINRTVTGGESWLATAIPYIRSNMIKLQFLDNLHGYGIFQQANIIATDDGGVSWKFTQKSTAFATDFHFCDLNNGWVIGDMMIIEYTKDAGQTWESVPRDRQPQGTPRCMSFISSQVGYISTTDSGHSILSRTVDGGKSWSKVGSFPDRAISALCFIDQQNGVIGFSGGNVAVTADSGFTWQAAKSSTPETFIKIRFSDQGEGWTLSDKGNLFRTQDLGRTWELVRFKK